jgi:ABC-type multidrug transport system fused ATPase/permease subunit
MDNIIVKTVIRLKAILPNRFRKKGIIAVFLLLINSLLELLGLASIIPLFTVIIKDGAIQQNYYLSFIYNTFGYCSERNFIVTICGFVVLIIFIKNIIGILIQKYQSRFSLDLMSFFMLRLHKYFFQKGFLFFKETNSVLINRDIFAVPQRFSQIIVLGVFNLFHEILVLILIVTAIVLYNPGIVLLLLFTVVPVFVIFYLATKNKIKKLGDDFHNLSPEIGNNIFQSVFGYIDVMINGTYLFFSNRIKKNMNSFRNISIDIIVYKLIPTKLIEVSMISSVFVITIYGLKFMSSKEELLNLLGIYTIAAYRIMPSINRIMIALNGITENQYTIPVLEKLINFKSDGNKKVSEIVFTENISLNQVFYKYPNANHNIIDNFNCTINKGEIICIKGNSGGGKTTLMNLMLGFLKPTYGEIKIDGQVLNNHNIESWQKKIGYVQQEVYLLDNTIAENIAFGLEKTLIDYNKINLVLKQASLIKFIESLDDGIDTLVGERGANLSGGQRQRIGIARALYFDSEVLFLDEVTSALDPETELEVNKTIESLSINDGITIVMIAHRETGLDFVNKIIRI